MQKLKVLFMCIHNSARSQMAEAFLNEIAGERFEAQSAGIELGELNFLVVKVMAEAGVDISQKQTTGVFDLYRKGAVFSYVITVCDEASAEKCPIFPGVAKRIHWSFPDPSALQGSEEDKLRGTREIRDAIKAQIEEWVKTLP